MVVMTKVSQIQLNPGSTIVIQDLTWPAFEALLEELGEKRNTHLAYYAGTLEIMSPLPQHERAIVVISDLAKVLLRLQRRPWESLRSTTFKRLGIAGVEPDDCFYIANYRAVIGKDRVDLAVDPPPDLAIESDLTSKTEANAYRAIGVPELWIYSAGQLAVQRFVDGEYVEVSESEVFPGVAIGLWVIWLMERVKTVGTSEALREFEEAMGQGGFGSLPPEGLNTQIVH